MNSHLHRMASHNHICTSTFYSSAQAFVSRIEPNRARADDNHDRQEQGFSAGVTANDSFPYTDCTTCTERGRRTWRRDTAHCKTAGRTQRASTKVSGYVNGTEI
jgi:hypothetical protein